MREAAIARYGNDLHSFGGQRDGFVEGAKWAKEKEVEELREKIAAQFFETISNQEMNLAHLSDELKQARQVIENLYSKTDIEAAYNAGYNYHASIRGCKDFFQFLDELNSNK